MSLLNNDQHQNEQKYKKWISCTSPDILVRESVKQKGIGLAIKCVEAAGPVLERFGCGMIAEEGDIPCFMQVTMQGGSRIGASLVVAEESTEESMHHLRCYGDDAKALTAAYVLDFQDAVFLYQPTDSDAAPKRLFLLAPEKSMSPKNPFSYACLKNLVLNGNAEFSVGYE